jgi:hypothetical protein
MRNVALLIGTLALATGHAPAQETRPWAERLFDYKTEHDFGSVPHGAQMAHKFSFTNPYQVPLDITITRISCGCVTAASSTQTIKPRESGSIDVNMNGRQFTGPRTVRVHVQFSNPQFYSTAELKVTANSRPDVVLNPGQVTFGVVPQGQAATQSIDVEYAGVLDWRVTDVMPNGLPVEIRPPEKLRYAQPGQAGYRITVTLKADAPAGAVKGELFVKTNDPAGALVPILVEATVQPSLHAAPATLHPVLKVGEEKSVSVAVRGNKDFRIVAVDGLGDGVSLATELPDAPAASHRLTFRFQRGAAGAFHARLRIKTDLQAAPVVVTVEGNVTP